MYDPQQHFVDLQENSSFVGDTNSWLSVGDESSPTHGRIQAQLAGANTTGARGNLDRVLFNDLVEMVPLVQSLIDRKANNSFTRRGSMIYTKTPSRESLSRKIDPKGRNAAQSILEKKKKDHGDKDQGRAANNNQDAENFSLFSSRALATEKDAEELVALRERVEDLQRKLLEKDELLKSAVISKTQVTAVHAECDELKHHAAEKDSLIKSVQNQLSDAKIKLADKQAALEKIQWEAMTSSRKAEKLQEELDSIQGDISSFMLLFEDLTKNESTRYAEDYDIKPHYSDHDPDIDGLDFTETQNIEEAREAYIAAVAAAKEKQDDASIAAAASARRYLLSVAFRSNSMNASRDYSNGQFD